MIKNTQSIGIFFEWRQHVVATLYTSLEKIEVLSKSISTCMVVAYDSTSCSAAIDLMYTVWSLMPLYNPCCQNKKYIYQLISRNNELHICSTAQFKSHCIMNATGIYLDPTLDQCKMAVRLHVFFVVLSSGAIVLCENDAVSIPQQTIAKHHTQS